jgi:uncharacterized alpha-E superfamily protein
MVSNFVYAMALLTLSISTLAQNNAELSANSIEQAQAEAEVQSRQESLTVEAQQRIKRFATTLKTALVSAIQEQGLVHAVDVCHSVAPQIAESLSTEGWQVARTSLKTRNQNNQADMWERDTLEDFDRRFKAGTPAGELTASLQSDTQFRYMKAIPTDKVCLACHGSTVDETLSQAIINKYPQDRAVGFTLEDIRGAFTLSKQTEK